MICHVNEQSGRLLLCAEHRMKGSKFQSAIASAADILLLRSERAGLEGHSAKGSIC
jgi:hypothetical protein